MTAAAMGPGRTESHFFHAFLRGLRFSKVASTWHQLHLRLMHRIGTHVAVHGPDETECQKRNGNGVLGKLVERRGVDVSNIAYCDLSL